MSAAMQWCGVHIKNGEVVFLDVGRTRLVVVIGCFAVDTDTWGLLVRATELVSRAAHWSKWTVSADVTYHLLRSDKIWKAAFHRYVGPQCLEVLH